MSANTFRRIEAALLVAGSACLAAYLWTVAERIWYQSRYTEQWEEDFAAGPIGAGATRPLRHGVLARIEIPRADVSAAVLDGVDSQTLRRAVGHVPGTAYPGESGRVALAAHRDTFFSKLRFLERGDTVKLIARGRTEEYTVETISVVSPEQTEVLAPTSEPVLTLVTCYPFSFVGRAPKRFIVEARLKDMTAAAPVQTSVQAKAIRKRPRAAHPAPVIAPGMEATDLMNLASATLAGENEPAEEVRRPASGGAAARILRAAAVPFRKTGRWLSRRSPETPPSI